MDGDQELREKTEWEKRIVDWFIVRSNNGNYESNGLNEILPSLGFQVDSNLYKAWDNLCEKSIIIEARRAAGKTFLLNTWMKTTIIREIVHKDPISEHAKYCRPKSSYFNDMIERFTYTTANVWPNQGTYFFCTSSNDPSFWVVFVKSKPNKNHLTYKLGSIKEKNSKISQMWKTILEVWYNGDKKSIFKKMAEDKNQKVFGNNRQPATAAFVIFSKFGWIKEVSRKGKQIFYDIIDDESYEHILNNKIPICPKCGMPAKGNYCVNCKYTIT